MSDDDIMQRPLRRWDDFDRVHLMSFEETVDVVVSILEKLNIAIGQMFIRANVTLCILGNLNCMKRIQVFFYKISMNKVIYL
jgi:hypothetical protein